MGCSDGGGGQVMAWEMEVVGRETGMVWREGFATASKQFSVVV